MRIGERIPNLVSELKSDDIYPSFLAKKLLKTGKVSYFVSFDSFMATKGGQLLSNFNSKTRFVILSSRRIF